MSKISTKDNNCGALFFDLHTEGEQNVTSDDYHNLAEISNTSVKDLIKDNSSLLVFPHVLGYFEDGIQDEHIFDFTGNPKDKTKLKLTTRNLMGFIGISDTLLKISSRFSNGDDHFMHYMLQRVFSINLFDYQYTSSRNGELDLLMFSFPVLLKKALTQGLYRKYRTFERNDANIKGIVNVSHHIKNNYPFHGSVAYRSRERTVDNSLTELIRHTIEFIKTTQFGKSLLTLDHETKECVHAIMSITTSYKMNEREKIISQNLVPINHPYYTAYKPLQKLCLAILRHKKIGYGYSNKKVYGILFDGAWLWEEYLATILKKNGFIHPKNKVGTDSIYVYKGNPRFPDFFKGHQIKSYSPNENINDNFVLDAKYKHLDKQNFENDEIRISISREDLHQLITYMFIMPAKKAGLIYPYDKNDLKTQEGKLIISKEINIYGYEGRLRTYGVPIPLMERYKDFVNYMLNIEREISNSNWN